MLIKGIIFTLIFALFVSRVIPKYVEYRETNIVRLVGIDWTGNVGAIVLLLVMLLGISVLVIAIQNFYMFFTRQKKQD
jgi:hypothetical protein